MCVCTYTHARVRTKKPPADFNCLFSQINLQLLASLITNEQNLLTFMSLKYPVAPVPYRSRILLSSTGQMWKLLYYKFSCGDYLNIETETALNLSL